MIFSLGPRSGREGLSPIVKQKSSTQSKIWWQKPVLKMLTENQPLQKRERENTASTDNHMQS